MHVCICMHNCLPARGGPATPSEPPRRPRPVGLASGVQRRRLLGARVASSFGVEALIRSAPVPANPFRVSSHHASTTRAEGGVKEREDRESEIGNRKGRMRSYREREKFSTKADPISGFPDSKGGGPSRPGGFFFLFLLAPRPAGSRRLPAPVTPPLFKFPRPRPAFFGPPFFASPRGGQRPAE